MASVPKKFWANFFKSWRGRGRGALVAHSSERKPSNGRGLDKFAVLVYNDLNCDI